MSIRDWFAGKAELGESHRAQVTVPTFEQLEPRLMLSASSVTEQLFKPISQDVLNSQSQAEVVVDGVAYGDITLMSTEYGTASAESGTDRVWTSPNVEVYSGWSFSGYPADATVYQVKGEWDIDANYIEDVKVYVDNSSGLVTSQYDIDVTGDDWIIPFILDDGYSQSSHQNYTWSLSGSGRTVNQSWWFNAKDIYDDSNNEWDKGRIDWCKITLYYSYYVDDEGPYAPTPDLSSSSDTGHSSSDNITRDDTPTFTWNTPSDRGGGYVVGFWWEVDDSTPDTWTTGNSATTGLLSNGWHTFYVRAKDNSNNPGDVGSLSFLVDDASPSTPSVDLRSSSDTGYSSSDNVTRDSTPAFDFASSDSHSGVYRYWYELGDSTPDYSTTSSSWTAPSLSNGTYTLYVQAEDGAGNFSSVGNLTFTIDTSAPSTPWIDLRSSSDSGYSSSDNITNDNTPTVDFGAGGAYRYWYDINDSSPDQGPTTGTSWTTGSLGDGNHTIYVQAEDVAGNYSGLGSLGVTIDRTAPGAPPMVSPIDGNVTYDTTPRLDWNSAYDATSGVQAYRVQVDGPVGAPAGWFFPDRDVWVGASTTYWDVSPALGEGTWYWRVMAEDKAGNPGPWGGDATGPFGAWGGENFAIIISPPGAPGTPDLAADDDTMGRSNSDNITYKTSDLTFSWTASSGYAERYYYAWDDSTPTSLYTSGLSKDVDAPSGHGNHTFYVRGWNPGGGYGPASALTVYIDRVHPSVSNVDLRNSDDSGYRDYDNITNDTNVRFTWSGNSNGGSGIYRYWYGWTSSANDGSTSNNYKDISPPSNNGTYTFYVGAEAVSGLWAYYPTYTDQETVTWDTIAPGAPPMVSPIDGDVVYDTTPRLDWNSAYDATSGVQAYRVQVDGPVGAPLGWLYPDRDVWVGASTTSWDVSPALGEGTWYWRVMAEDKAGNPGPWGGDATGPFGAWGGENFDIIISPPGAPGTPDLAADDDTMGRSNSDNITYKTTDLTFSWAASSGYAERYYYAWDYSTPTSSYTSGLSKDVDAPSGHGNHTFYVRGWNPGGGYGPVSALTVYIDRVHPSVSNVDLRSSDDTGYRDYDNITNDTNVRFTWQGYSNGGSGIYRYWYGWTTNANDANTTNTYADVVPPSGNGTYTFYVGAEAESGMWAYYPDYNGQESVTWDTTPPSAPPMVSPVDRAKVFDLTPRLDWNSAYDATSGVQAYRVQVDGPVGAPLGWLIPDRDVWVGASTTYWDVSPALGEGTWYWRVMAEDKAGNPGPWGGDATGPFGAWGGEEFTATDVRNDWTIMAYMATDNNMSDAAKADINEMEASVLGPSIDALVLVDYLNDDTYRGRICHDTDVGNITSPLHSMGELDMGQGQNLTDFMIWGAQNYPAQNYAVILYDHGGGFTGFGSPPEDMEIFEIRGAIEASGGDVDLIGFDACLMGMTEVAYEFQDVASTFVASESVEWFGGAWAMWPYTSILNALSSSPSMSPSGLGQTIVDSYGDFWSNITLKPRTLSSVATSQLDSLGTSIDTLAAAALDNASSSDWARLRVARDTAQGYYIDTYRDFREFAEAVHQDVSINSLIRNAALGAENALDLAVEANWTSQWIRGEGLSIYLPTLGDSMDGEYDSDLAFVADTRWGEFVSRMMGISPDLRGSDCYAPTSAYWGVTIDLQGQARNVDDGAAGSFMQKFYLSADTNWGDADDYYLGSYSHGPLDGYSPGSDFSLTITLPSAPPDTEYLTRGTYYIGMKTDANDAVDESDETNNGPGDYAEEDDWDTIALGPRGNVELTLYRVSDTSGTPNSSNPGTSKTSFVTGETVRVTLRADNTGQSVPVKTVLNLRAPDNTTWAYDSHAVGQDNSADSPLNSGESDYYSFDWAIPSGAQAGPYDILGAIRDYSHWDLVYDTTLPGRNNDFGPGDTLLDQFSVTGNQAPTDIALSNSTVAENEPVGSTVGTFSTTDPNLGDTFIYSLVSGTGNADNGSFVIDGNQLKTDVSFDYEAKSSYSIRVRSTDQGELYTEKIFTIQVDDVDDTPPTISNIIVNNGQQYRSHIDSLELVFSENVLASLDVGDLGIYNDTAHQAVDTSGAVLDYALTTDTATWDMSGVDLTDGYYTATLSAAGVTDTSDNHLDGNGDGTGGDDYTFTFFVLKCDANGDACVDSADLAIWQQNYDPLGLNNNTPSMGDWDYDGDIDSADLALWQQNYDPIGLQPPGEGGGLVAGTMMAGVENAFPDQPVSQPPTEEAAILAAKAPAQYSVAIETSAASALPASAAQPAVLGLYIPVDIGLRGALKRRPAVVSGQPSADPAGAVAVLPEAYVPGSQPMVADHSTLKPVLLPIGDSPGRMGMLSLEIDLEAGLVDLLAESQINVPLMV